MKKVIKVLSIIIISLILIFGCLVGYIIVDSNKQEELLNKEVDKLLSSDFLNDDINTNVVTSGEYAVIEKIIKKYIKDFSDTYKEFYQVIDEFNFEDMFTAGNFVNDGPDFVNSKGKLSNLKTTLADCLDKMTEMSSEKYIMNFIKNKDIDDYYIDLYKDYMFGNTVNSFDDYMKEDIELINNFNKDVNQFFDDCYSLYDFMSINRSTWQVEWEIVYFSTDSLVNQYNDILNKIIEDSNKLATYEEDDNNTGVYEPGSV